MDLAGIPKSLWEHFSRLPSDWRKTRRDRFQDGCRNNPPAVKLTRINFRQATLWTMDVSMHQAGLAIPNEFDIQSPTAIAFPASRGRCSLGLPEQTELF